MSSRGSVPTENLLKKILNQDLKYDIEAYAFVLDALSFTLRKLKEVRHISAIELLDGIRRYALHSFGPMARTVFEHWDIRSCEDFGEIVFCLVQCGLIAKQESDLKVDFKKGYDFQEAFDKPFHS